MRDKTDFVRLANIAVDKGVNVRIFSKEVLEILSQESDFKHRDQAKRSYSR